MNQPRPEVELRLTELKKSGAYPVYAINAIRDEFGLSLNEAKTRFAQSPAWAAEQAAAEVLHQQILDALREDGTD
jgi:ribosomal protein L7/L12